MTAPSQEGQEDDPLTPEDYAWVERLVDSWEPLPEEDRVFLARMFRKRR